MRERRAGRPPLPFDTTAALRKTVPAPPPIPEESPAAFEDEASITEASYVPDAHEEAALATPAAADSFPHSRHEKLPCLTCHVTGSGKGRLTFERPRGCQICHHQSPTSNGCATCHRIDKYGAPKPATVTVTVPGQPPRSRPVDFLHGRHASRPCMECHTTPVSLAAAPDKAACRDCHTEHHAVGPNCGTCHRVADPKAAHANLEVAHQRCDACHTPSSVARLTPTRTLCATCHSAKATGHYEPRECSTCHFLAEPSVFRAKLMTRRPA